MKEKTLFFIKNNQNLGKRVILIFFVIELFLSVASYQYFQNTSILINLVYFFRKNILYNSTVSNFESKFFNG